MVARSVGTTQTAIPIATSPSQPLPGDEFRLPVPFVSQKPYSELCWAACCTMVNQAIAQRYPGQFPDLPTTMCTVVSKIFGKSCCPDPAQFGADAPEDIDVVYNKCGLPFTAWPDHFPWDSIEHEIGVAKRPIEAYYRWQAGAHVALIVGYKRSSRWLYVLDPLYGEGWTQYDDVVQGYGLGNWTDTYYNVGYSLG